MGGNGSVPLRAITVQLPLLVIPLQLQLPLPLPLPPPVTFPAAPTQRRAVIPVMQLSESYNYPSHTNIRVMKFSESREFPGHGRHGAGAAPAPRRRAPPAPALHNVI